MQALLTAISRRNLTVDASDRLTSDMLKLNIEGSPIAIFEFIKTYGRGDVAWDWAVQDVFKRLCIQAEKKAPGGVITLGSRQFTSPELQIYCKAVARMNNGRSAVVKIFELPNTPFLLLWELPGGGMGVIDATEKTQKMYADGGMYSIAFQHNYRKHLLAEARWAGRREATKAAMVAIENAKKSAAAAVPQTKQSKIDTVEQNAEDAVPLVSADDSPKKKAKSVSDFETAVSILAQVVPEYRPPGQTRTSVARPKTVVTAINNHQSLVVDDDDDE